MVGKRTAEIVSARALSDYVFDEIDMSNDDGAKDGHITPAELFRFVSSVLSNPKIDPKAGAFLEELGFTSQNIDDQIAVVEAVFLAMDTNHDGWISREELFNGFLVHLQHKSDEHAKMKADWVLHLHKRREMQRVALVAGLGVALFGVGILLGSTETGRGLLQPLFAGSTKPKSSGPAARGAEGSGAHGGR